MVSFIVYDLGFMILFGIVVFFLLHKYRQNLKRQGWIFLYHSKFGLKFIDWTAKKFEKILKPLQYLVITSGYILMAIIIWMIGLSAWKYITSEIPEQLQNVPPVAPLIPYFPKLFGLESFFPPLYFTYFLVALAIVAVSHEFAHGIFARLNKIKVKTTGLAFFGPFFGAFVEPDEKQMYRQKKFPQLSILAAGTFANVVMTILFLGIMALFFSLSFQPAGVYFNAYPQSVVNVGQIDSINGNFIDDFEDVEEYLVEEDFNVIAVGENMFLVPDNVLIQADELGVEQIIAFDDAPAVRAKLTGPILEIDNVKVTSQPELSNTLLSHEPGDTILIKTLDENEGIDIQEITLGERDGKAYLGIGFILPEQKGFMGFVNRVIQSIKNPLTYYEPSWDGDFVQFLYDLLWWIVVINILVALFNMLPVSILDGGRFFYLTIWGITGKESWGKKAYKWATWLILLLLVLMMIRWVFVFAS
ncbi:hypothetical protein COU62_03555 [Candidatus Pacearchaeota archaeon CG10_big_fil_rev_8_21_14_0_10_35_219]|nr:hypothetical protein [Candidatus Pacearchaeota archaeon]PIO07428.1 MAG: hypothetical protein COU62_03555 [Candidatus Pacearchaeota archaeon CG10_big_fil_rev_8_21_14_0_10_35_219]PIY81234.1 MAG: hypothetical protein COY79_03050 [Candidatus Pacearchaeota archaeon CG_4_10_14_0_8_um_filter_35_169]PIZ80164.1 MAG: hypothetical protein COY00_01700 [Candidatus Pacearchaeota archaeon CG_4_10_14_0_2_um_filter_35_33]PJA69572.1 MAG: hypothetical protein CO155_04850 [Candidatus Pacearchaeota archaeon CG_4